MGCTSTSSAVDEEPGDHHHGSQESRETFHSAGRSAAVDAPLILPALLVQSTHSAGSLRGRVMRSIALGAIASLVALSCARAGLPSDWRDHQTAFGKSAFTIKMTTSAAGRRPGLRSDNQGDPAYELGKAFAQATTSTPANGRSAGATPPRKRPPSGSDPRKREPLSRRSCRPQGPLSGLHRAIRASPKYRRGRRVDVGKFRFGLYRLRCGQHAPSSLG